MKEYVEGWHKIKPDMIFLTDTSTIPIGIAMKRAYKKMYPEDKVKFYRISPNELMHNSVPLVGVKTERYDYADPGHQFEVEDGVRWLSNFTEIIKKIEKIENKRAIIYDENCRGAGSSQPYHYLHDGKRYLEEEDRFLKDGERRKQNVCGRTFNSGIKLLQQAGFKEVWAHTGSPKFIPEGYVLKNSKGENYVDSYFRIIQHEKYKILKGKMRGPKPIKERKEAEEFLSELKLVADYAVKFKEALEKT